MFGKNLTSKSSKNKIFCGFRVFSMAKSKNPEMPEINKNPKIQKAPSVKLLSLLENC